MISLFWFLFAVIFYTFVGYGLVLYLLVLVKRLFRGRAKQAYLPAAQWPTVSFVVAVFNEEYILEEKIQNTLSLDYPEHLLQYIFITDGSSDRSPEIVKKYSRIQLLHQPRRNGKLAAMERAIAETTGEILIFSDANTILNTASLKEICKHYQHPLTGAVAGEKKVLSSKEDDAAGSESMYWKYESALKKWDSELYSVVGAAGELFSVRKALYVSVPKDTILDDFMISLRIAEKGYRIVYEPAAYAAEYSSANVGEEYKRKVRIAAGGIQSIVRLWRLLLPWPRPVLWFQYISHRVLRWTVTPFCMILLLLLNIAIVAGESSPSLYTAVLCLQLLFYGMALVGWYFENRALKIKAFFIPYYFCMMNTAVIGGIFRYFRGRQTVQWDKAQRKSAVAS